MNLESPLSTISINSNGTLIAVGGKSLLKVLKKENNELKILKPLKVAKTNSKTGTTDVAWNHHDSNTLASTTLLGSNVIIWDVTQINLNKSNYLIGSHTQLINRICWNFKNKYLLASCSQDGIIYIWNTAEGAKTLYKEIHTKEKIRDCQFSPFHEHLILASFVSGGIKLYNTEKIEKSGGINQDKNDFFRIEKLATVKQFIGHETDVLSIDWHPTLEYIFCSGSMDKNIYIWDTNKEYPIQSFKTSHGVSRIKWWKKNPQYIISSYQTNNFYVNLWNVNIKHMPEYVYKGHKDVVTGFCCDLNDDQLITCSKDNFILLSNFSDGYRSMDNVCTNFTKFDDDKIYFYSDQKPLKTGFNDVNYSGLINENHINKKYYLNIMSTASNNFISNSNYLNFNQYYSFPKKEIKFIFENYLFLSTLKPFQSKNYLEKLYMNNHKTTTISAIVNYNWKFSKDKLKNYNHLAVWTQLKFLTEMESFSYFENYNEKNDLMKEIFINNINQIIKFLIDCHSDLWLATIIIYIFHDLFPFNKSNNLKIVTECYENLRKNKLYKISGKLMKFAVFDELKKNKENSLILLGCKKCGMSQDLKNNEIKCKNCDTKLKCQICTLPLTGLIAWCSICSHGGHPEHISGWFKFNKTCPSGCGHICR